MTGPDLCARLLEAIEQAESAKQKATWKRGDLCLACGEETFGYKLTVMRDAPMEATAQPCGCRMVGEEQVREFQRCQPDPDPAVSRRCAEVRRLVEWCVGWQKTFRGPIPEGHTQDSALHFRMAAEFVLDRVMAAYGVSWDTPDPLPDYYGKEE